MASIKMATMDWRLVTVVAFLWNDNTEKPRVGNVTDIVAAHTCNYILTCLFSCQEQQEEDQVSHRSSTSRLSRSPLRAVKKVKIMQCKVTLLDGSDYTLDVEVRKCSFWFNEQEQKHCCCFIK